MQRIFDRQRAHIIAAQKALVASLVSQANAYSLLIKMQSVACIHVLQHLGHFTQILALCIEDQLRKTALP